MAEKSSNTLLAEQLRKKVLAEAQAPFTDPITAYTPGSLTEGVTAGVKAYQKGKELEVLRSARGISPGTETAFQAQRAGEREDLTRFGDDKEKMGAALSRSLGGSKTFTKSEIRRGYRKL